MPQLLVLAAAGVGIYLGARALRRRLDGLGERVKAAADEAAARRAGQETSGMRALGDLEYDEASQTYRPKQD